MRLTTFLCSAVLLLAAACGQPKAGDSCDQTGFLCADAKTALECRAGTWRALPCAGADGCVRNGDNVSCDMSGNKEGDACASTAEGKGLCTAEANGTLECRQGELVKTNDCTTCTIEGDEVICQP